MKVTTPTRLLRTLLGDDEHDDRQHRQLARILDAVQDGVLVADADLRITVINQAALDWLRLDADRAIGESLLLVLGARVRTAEGSLLDSTRLRSGWLGEVRVRSAKNVSSPMWLKITPLLAVPDQPNRFVLVLSDLTLLKQAASQMERMAQFDRDTGVANRALIGERLDAAIARTDALQRGLAVLFISPDRLHLFRDAVGDNASGQLLVDLVQRLVACGIPADALGRFGDDEFVAILEDTRSAEEVEALVREVLQALAWRLGTELNPLSVSTSIGIALYPADGSSGEALFKAAHVALDRARQLGGGRFQFSEPQWAARAYERLLLANGLRDALERDEFAVLYQPKVNAHTRLVTGVEALLRWNTARWPDVGPADFIGIAEETGLISAIGGWVLERACRDAAAWRRAGARPITVAVNVSGFQIMNGNLPAAVERALALSGLDAECLELEITESVLQTPHAADLLRQLKKLGLTIALDDFGTGYSSLASLGSLPFDRLKIDRSFVSRLPEDEQYMAITRAIVAMSRELNLAVVAEGVETEAQRQCLASIGCHELQGYLFGRAMPAHEAQALLDGNQHAAMARL